ncbi:hypothetical protein Patl1_28854 [Pistacia atlantica]|uniref:Uncharacterized protein n=1 Tax=Pistacia atlantica TaxID=434234 RepID=A0ACC1BCU2_9ROSI|nr:hypothetical protein Patl1_28854 [Pistacia atlantica]
MAADRVSKPSKWFSNKGLRLSFPRRRSKSRSTSSSPTSPISQGESTTKKPSRDDELKEVFRHFDGDGDGKISALELRGYFASIGEYMSYEDAQGAINDLDTDGDNLLDFQDFLRLMQGEKKGCITPKGLQNMLNRLGDSKSYDECVAMIQIFDIDRNGVLDYQEFYRMMSD